MTPSHSILTDPKNAKASSQATSPAATKASSIRESLEVVATSGVLEGEADDEDVKRRRMQDMLSKLADKYEKQAVEAIQTANNNQKYRVTAEAKAKSDKMKVS